MQNKLVFFSIILFTLLTSSSLTSIVNASIVDSWESKASFPLKGEVVNCAVAVNRRIYVIGGSFNYEYDPVTDTWVEKTLMPTPRASFGFAVYHDKIYTLGGTMLNHENETVYSDLIEVYDPLTDVWESKKSMPLINTPLKPRDIHCL